MPTSPTGARGAMIPASARVARITLWTKAAVAVLSRTALRTISTGEARRTSHRVCRVHCPDLATRRWARNACRRPGRPTACRRTTRWATSPRAVRLIPIVRSGCVRSARPGVLNCARTDGRGGAPVDETRADLAATAGVTDLQSTRAGTAAENGAGSAAVNIMAGSNRTIGGPTRPDNRARPIELPPPAVHLRRKRLGDEPTGAAAETIRSWRPAITRRLLGNVSRCGRIARQQQRSRLGRSTEELIVGTAKPV